MLALKILSWNINGARTKMEKTKVYNLLSRYDIIGLNEVKTSLHISLPGYVSYKSSVSGGGHRGGTVVLIRRSLHPTVRCVDTSTVDQVWIRLTCLPHVTLGFVYIPPSDSPYFSPAQFSAIQERIKTADVNAEFFIIGDINARFGESVRNLPGQMDNHDAPRCTYPHIPDTVTAPNNNANTLATICIDTKMLVVNNLKTATQHFESKLTFRKASVWKSEIDVCVASTGILKCISDFDVLHDTSLPSDHAPITLTLQSPNVDMVELHSRALQLGDHATLYNSNKNNNMVKKPVSFNDINTERFNEALCQSDVPVNDQMSSVDEYADAITNMLYECSRESVQRIRIPPVDTTIERWDRLLQDDNDARVWRAIDWRGEYKETHDNRMCPDEQQFKVFFEELFNPPNVNELEVDDFTTPVSIPVLDSEISIAEVEYNINKLKVDKASGPDGLSPGIFKALPAQWLLSITALFNTIFMSGCYPSSWRLTRLFTIFKRGNRLLPINYRCINVMNIIAKVYDMVLCNRITQWFSPFREQAGSQPKRGCIEHITTLRLLIDLAKRKKFPLFITFIDFSQAYDRVPRATLFNVLRRMGCGAVMLAALVAMYRATHSIIGTAIVTATVGVRQGSPTSCILFVLFVNDLIKLLKENCGWDGFLSWLHVLVLMDDTVLMSTTRDGMIRKLSLLNQFCREYGMKINTKKTKFFAVNVSYAEHEPLNVDGTIVQWCDRYTYLGSVFTSDGSISSSIVAHAQTKMCHILKFVSFVKKNVDTPFYIKRRLFEAALMSTVLYGCESWLNGNLKPIEKLYNWGIKQLLGVRMTTCNEICYLELGMPPLRALVTHRQRKFFRNMSRERSGMVDDPLMHAINLVLANNTPTSRFLSNLISHNRDDIDEAMESLERSVSESNSSRRITYLSLNPTFVVHDVYCKRRYVNDAHRMSFTKLRVSGHNLAVETGRWNRRGRGRLPLEERLCSCGAIQTELHVVESCPLTQPIRDSYQFDSWQQLMSKDVNIAVKIVDSILSIYP